MSPFWIRLLYAAAFFVLLAVCYAQARDADRRTRELQQRKGGRA